MKKHFTDQYLKCIVHSLQDIIEKASGSPFHENWASCSFLNRDANKKKKCLITSSHFILETSYSILIIC
uniref:Uncharacterized protein n=1 Tax=Populus trichocarpa TaxID=3694 RepID=A0A2K1XFU1_POPTR